MASLAETRDSETGNHIRRTSHYLKVLAERLCADIDSAMARWSSHTRSMYAPLLARLEAARR